MKPKRDIRSGAAIMAIFCGGGIAPEYQAIGVSLACVGGLYIHFILVRAGWYDGTDHS